MHTFFAELWGLAGPFLQEEQFFKWPLLRTPYLDVISWRYGVDEVVIPVFDQIMLILILYHLESAIAITFPWCAMEFLLVRRVDISS